MKADKDISVDLTQRSNVEDERERRSKCCPRVHGDS